MKRKVKLLESLIGGPQMHLGDHLPSGEAYLASIGPHFARTLAPHLETHLLAPVREFVARPSKQFRALLVKVGALLSLPPDGDITEQQQKFLDHFSAAVEFTHASSLILDDLEDKATVRRGGPTLQRKYPVPTVMNSAGWLSWYPTTLASTYGLSPTQELELLRLATQEIARTYAGQSLDIGMDVRNVAPSELYDNYMAVAECKTGTLVAGALLAGAIAVGASPERTKHIRLYGNRLGVMLQIFDDIGNYDGKRDPEKRFEDLRNHALSWIWAIASKNLSPEDYRELQSAAQALPDTTKLDQIESRLKIAEMASAEGKRYMRWLHSSLEEALPLEDGFFKELFAGIKKIGEKIAGSY